MRYLGGKYRIGRWISETIEKYRGGCSIIIEPFMGGLGATPFLRGDILASDKMPLAYLYRAWENGWRPEPGITPERRLQHKLLPQCDPQHLFSGFALSFGGDYYAGFARDSQGTNYQEVGERSLNKKINTLRGRVKYFHCDYTFWSPVKGCVIYCDPPYASTTGYSTGKFDHCQFWSWCRNMAENNVVLISEYSAPSDFLCLAEKARHQGLRTKGNTVEHRLERIFTPRA